MQMSILVDSAKVAETIAADVSAVDHWLSGHVGELEGIVHAALADHLAGADLPPAPAGETTTTTGASAAAAAGEAPAPTDPLATGTVDPAAPGGA